MDDLLRDFGFDESMRQTPSGSSASAGSAALLSKNGPHQLVLFMVTSLSLSIMATRNAGLGTSVLESPPQERCGTGEVPARQQVPGDRSGAARPTAGPNSGTAYASKE
jgi:hypothetical protein